MFSILLRYSLSYTVSWRDHMTKNTRRRGDQLEKEIFEATYELMNEGGISAVSFSDVAKKAHTSRTVLYRYWDTPFDLMFATIDFMIGKDRFYNNARIFDYGTLHKDLIYVGTTFMEVSSKGASKFIRLLFLSAMDEQDEQKIQEILNRIKTENLQLIYRVIENALERGELKKHPPEVTLLAFFNQIRYSSLIGEQLNQEKIVEIVDQLIFPAIQKLGADE